MRTWKSIIKSSPEILYQVAHKKCLAVVFFSFSTSLYISFKLGMEMNTDFNTWLLVHSSDWVFSYLEEFSVEFKLASDVYMVNENPFIIKLSLLFLPRKMQNINLSYARILLKIKMMRLPNSNEQHDPLVVPPVYVISELQSILQICHQWNV